jgi:hypothetical protein
MTKQSLDRRWVQLRKKYQAYLRLLDSIPAERYHSRLVPEMGTPAEQVIHISAVIVRDIAQGIAEGQIGTEESAEARLIADLGTKMAVIAYARKCWDFADDAIATIDTEQLNAMIETPWKMSVPGWVCFNMLNDEFLHHYGQLCTYARLCGAETPFLWGISQGILEYRYAD